MPKLIIVKLGHPRLKLPWTIVPEGPFRIVGTVFRGLEFGYLAIAPNGEYLQVNGAVTRPLNATKVSAAIRRAGGLQQWQVAGHSILPQPVVVIRKKRRVTFRDEAIA